MSLLAPLFLLGLAGLMVPIIIHLVHRQKPEGVPFPSLMFLRKIPHKAQRRQRIRHWLIFLLRCAALILVVLAFTRPLFERSPEALATLVGGRDVVVLLDRSFSMGFRDRWDRATDAANAVVDGMGPEDRVSIVTFDDAAQALNELSGDPFEVRAVLDRVTRGHGATRFGPAIKLAQSILDGGDRPRKEVVLITDFQRTGWDRQDIVRFTDNVTVRPVSLADGSVANRAVASVTVRQEPEGDRERAHISARVINPGLEDAAGVRVSLELNGQEVQQQTVDVAAGNSTNVVFAPALLPLGPSRAVVRLAADDLTDDDAFHFVLVPGQAVHVLILDGSSAQPNQSLYARRALEIGDDPVFRPVVKRLRNFRLSDLDDLDVLVLNDAPMPGGEAGQAIRTFVENGGGVFVALGATARGWPEELGDLLPGTVGARVEPRASRGGTITQLDYGHRVFEPFNAPRSGDLSAARVFRYRTLEVVPSDSVRVLARYDDGGVAVAERRVGKGRVMVLTTTLDTYWTDLPLKPVYLPFLHGVAIHLADHGKARPWFTVGSVADLGGYGARLPGGESLAAVFAAPGGEVVMNTPASERVRLATGGGGLFKIDHWGFYEVEVSDDVTLALAANVDPVESDLSPADVEEFVTSLAPVSEDAQAFDAAGFLTPDDLEQRQAVWWYLLIAAMLVFAAETLLSNRLSRVVR